MLVHDGKRMCNDDVLMVNCWTFLMLNHATDHDWFVVNGYPGDGCASVYDLWAGLTTSANDEARG